MPRLKERSKILHTPTTQEILICLSDMMEYSGILLAHGAPKPYSNFLEGLIKKDFFKDDEKRSIEKIAPAFNTDTAKITKWLTMIYDDIFTLNNERPELFQQEGIKITLKLRHHDSCCFFCLSLPVIPREFENFHFYFAKGKTGVSSYWVEQVTYLMEENKLEILISLQVATLNKYCEFIIDKALFQGKIGFGDVLRENSFDLDRKLKNIYRE